MGLKTPSVRPLNRSDLDKFKHFNNTVRGFAVEIDDKVVAVYGVLQSIPLQAFSEMDDELKKYPRVIMKCILSFKDILENYSSPIYAMPSVKHVNSPKVLERVGFEEIREGVYQWKPVHHKE